MGGGRLGPAPRAGRTRRGFDAVALPHARQRAVDLGPGWLRLGGAIAAQQARKRHLVRLQEAACGVGAASAMAKGLRCAWGTPARLHRSLAARHTLDGGGTHTHAHARRHRLRSGTHQTAPRRWSAPPPCCRLPRTPRPVRSLPACRAGPPPLPGLRTCGGGGQAAWPLCPQQQAWQATALHCNVWRAREQRPVWIGVLWRGLEQSRTCQLLDGVPHFTLLPQLLDAPRDCRACLLGALLLRGRLLFAGRRGAARRCRPMRRSLGPMTAPWDVGWPVTPHTAC